MADITAKGLTLRDIGGDLQALAGLGPLTPMGKVGGAVLSINVDEFTGQLDAAMRKQFPFAMMMALNRTTEEAQTAVQDRIRMRGFIIRSGASERWLTNQVKFYRGDRAQKDKLETALSIDGSAGFGNNDPGSFVGRSLLAFLEEGGDRQGIRAIGAGTVFGPSVVVPVRQSQFDQVPRSLYPINLGLQERRKIEGGMGKASLRGTRRSFTVRTSAGQGLVLQRIGSGRQGVRALFFIKPRVKVRGRQFFYSTVQRTVAERLGVNLAGYFKLAMETAK